jgi:small subunit ribosomal protein S21
MSYQNNKNKDTIRGLKIMVGDMPINLALKKFKQRVDDSGLLEEVKERMFYEKPTTVRKRKKGAARARWLKKLRDNELPKKLF